MGRKAKLGERVLKDIDLEERAKVGKCIRLPARVRKQLLEQLKKDAEVGERPRAHAPGLRLTAPRAVPCLHVHHGLLAAAGHPLSGARV